MELWQFLGNWHPKLVQFPLVLLLAGLLLDLAGVLWRSARARWAGLVVTGAGTMGLLFAFICGIYAEIWAGRAGVPQHPMELHELAANVASWGFVMLFAWRILMAGGEAAKRKWMGLYVGVGLGWYLLLALTGYLGGQLVFEYGAGVRGVTGVLSLEDLNTLAARQTDKNLWYSEWMHHIFGWMTLGLAVSLIAQAIVPQQARRLRWIVPAFLLAGGVFLFFMADRDLYALTDWRQWRDREVQLHKTLAVIMAVIGTVGMWRAVVSGRRSVARRGVTAETPAARKEGNSKLVAVLALIGGAMLFTHVHTVAPYANVAAGVYVAHVVMGLVALAIGAARMAQEFLPTWKRPLAVVFGVLMLAEAVLLVSYNEGLPWYIGYGRYNRWGPLGPSQPGRATVAPFGDFRAVMAIDYAEGKISVGFRDRFTDDAVQLTFDAPPQLLVTRGMEEFAIPLAGESGSGGLTGTDFAAHSNFVKNAACVSARLVLPMKGVQRMGYFDPWVTPLIQAVPPNEVAKWVCPMHAGIRSMDDQPGTCPLCGMPLVAIRPPRPAGELHDAAYELKVATSPAGLASETQGVAARLTLAVAADGKRVPLAIVHEQLIHLIIVSEDLAYFDHVHPSPLAGDKSVLEHYYLDYTFPRSGRYLLFADVAPLSDREQVFRVPLVVDAAGVRVQDFPVAGRTLTLDAAGGKLATVVLAPRTPQDSQAWSQAAPPGDVQVQYATYPRTIYAGLHTDLVFTLADASSRPITDLVPYLGAMGHCVVISQDTRQYVHVHPAQWRAPASGEQGGPVVAFGALFPSPGRYRVWAQFQQGQRMIYAVFSVEVKASVIPAGVLRALLNE
jgi:uncharacterized membrane protein